MKRDSGRVPSDWERQWIRWAKREMRRREKELLKGCGTAKAAGKTDRRGGGAASQ